jgi:hypothetical protein
MDFSKFPDNEEVDFLENNKRKLGLFILNSSHMGLPLLLEEDDTGVCNSQLCNDPPECVDRFDKDKNGMERLFDGVEGTEFSFVCAMGNGKGTGPVIGIGWPMTGLLRTSIDSDSTMLEVFLARVEINPISLRRSCSKFFSSSPTSKDRCKNDRFADDVGVAIDSAEEESGGGEGEFGRLLLREKGRDEEDPSSLE